MTDALKINRKNLRRLAWRRGFSVAGLARKIGRSRMQVYRAVDSPERNAPTFDLIREVLSE